MTDDIRRAPVKLTDASGVELYVSDVIGLCRLLQHEYPPYAAGMVKISQPLKLTIGGQTWRVRDPMFDPPSTPDPIEIPD